MLPPVVLRSVTWALRELDINWDAHFRWSRGSRRLDLSVPQQLLDRAGRETSRKHMKVMKSKVFFGSSLPVEKQSDGVGLKFVAPRTLCVTCVLAPPC